MTIALLSLVSDGCSFGIDRQTWTAGLAAASPDPKVHIRHAALKGDAVYRYHVAQISDRVACHFHKEGKEEYAVVDGCGVLHWGRVANDASDVEWEQPVLVRQGDRFVIPQGYAHQLQRAGDRPIIILFACPDTHLNDDLDRVLLSDAPGLR